MELPPGKFRASLIAQLVKNPAAMKETPVWFLGQEDLLEKGQAAHSSILGLSLWLSWSGIRLQCRRSGFDPWGGKIPWRRERLPTPVFWPGEFHGLYSLWGHKELDMTEQLSLHRANLRTPKLSTILLYISFIYTSYITLCVYVYFNIYF